MAIHKDVLNALFALDSYNRGYDSKIKLSGIRIGNVNIGLHSVDLLGPSEDSFFAQTYTLNGQTIISFRGTDSPEDALTGWSGGAGEPYTQQAMHAIDMYNAVLANNPYIELVGHSLGGGLAGYLAGLYGEEATIFDNMAFERAVVD